ncbi:DinB family protein [uncultured Flavobacterium sp.]|jgi:hypothetical protein|uniref:DinB family protein n=1 Tax=uncultured Flavobacterium sp. TaxID=165435 RepID=UPI0030CA2521
MQIPKTEYASFYASYVEMALNKTLSSDFESQMTSCIDFYNSITLELLDYRYEPFKWSIKDIILHLIDSERIFAYRALRISRNDKTKLPGFEENDYVTYANASSRSLEDIINEYRSVRNATISLFNSFSDGQLKRIGNASDKEVSVRAIGYIILGHELHHIKIIKERYLNF